MHDEDDPPSGIGHVLVQRDLVPLWFLGTVFGLVLTGIFVFVKRFVMVTEVATVGTFFSAYTGAAIAVRLVGGRLPDRVGPKRVLLPALATLVAGFGCLAAAETSREVLAAGVLCGLGPRLRLPDAVVAGRLARIRSGTRRRDLDPHLVARRRRAARRTAARLADRSARLLGDVRGGGRDARARLAALRRLGSKRAARAQPIARPPS